MSDTIHDNGVIPSIETDTTSTTTNGSSLDSLENAKNAALNNASAAANAVKNHPITQNIVNGPVVDNVKDQHAKTQAEFSNLAASRTTPAGTTATGQQLTHYHSFFSSLLSWNNPRASGIAYLSIVAFIFAARYLNVLRYAFKLTYITLAVTVLAEGASKALISRGLVSQLRPKKYYTLPKESLDSMIGDAHELINFFVIESQRLVFAENVLASAAAFFGAFLSYYLIKIVPFWGLTLLSTTVLFLAPLIYKSNKEVIDTQLAKVSNIVNQQTEQVKQLASHHAARAAENTKAYAADYSAKAQEIIGNARGRSTSPVATKSAASGLKENSPTFKNEDFPVAPVAPVNPTFQSTDFPVAPQDEFASKPINHLESEPLIST